ncbi:GTPase activating protein [Extremus antarcticus]|uniref:GTPase activating protein n=1 Tax=Extremus antarcticus TaxID=702011 RepID=A0AAJ0GEP9_9PEZI|nr:GTPase activating protein [Extremus antarcticus]
MSSYLSNLLTQTTSRYQSFRRTLLSNEDDGDTEDDSHISRVLRAYYTEKGRSYPPWLPSDPNDRQAITPRPYAQPGSSYMSNITGAKSSYAPVQNQAQNQPGARSSLSDLWDPPSQAQPAPVQPQSLRAGRRPLAAAPMPTSNPGGLAPRPLPSQRAGSYQSMQSTQSGRSVYDQAQTPPASSGGGTAQDRLKARLYGSRSASSAGGQGPYEPPPPSNYDSGGGRRFGR